MSAPPILEARGTTLSYPAPRGSIVAVDDVSLRIDPGECVAILGRSGSGKSTLLALLAGLCEPTTGEVLFDGRPWRERTVNEINAARTTGIGLLLQDGGLLPGLRALDNILLPAVLAGKSHAEAVARAEQLLAMVGLRDRWDAYPAELSGGQKRRIALARALTNNPAVILADEPTGDLDGMAAREITGILEGIRGTRRTAIVLVTHDPELSSIADKRFWIERGRCAPFRNESAQSMAVSFANLGETCAPVAPVFEPPPATLVSRPPGSGIGDMFFHWLPFLGGIVAAAAFLAIVDGLIAGKQEAVVQGVKAQRRMAEEMAMQDLRTDVDDVALAPDGGVSLTIYLQNYRPERLLHVLGPVIEVGIQRNGRWDNTATSVGFDTRGIRAIGQERTVLGARFSMTEERYDELLPGYIHVRIGAVMVVSDKPDGTGDLFERRDAYYIYLRDPRRPDDWIRRANKWSEKASIPVWISMPSH